MSRTPPTSTKTFIPSGSDGEAPTKVELEATSESRAGGALGRYEIERTLGEGGMGQVLLARDPVVGRQVALKTMRDPDKVTARARFAREARLQGQLEHPAIVPVYDVGTAEDGSPFFTMKRVRGESLAAVLAQMASGEAPRFSRRKLLTAFSQLCLAVHYAHERGVVHRDIKPTNIMLGRYGEVYLLDWGVAKLAHEAPDTASDSDSAIDAASPLHTGVGTVVGSLGTMSPEQVAGGEIDARADVYALGAVLFEILSLEALHPRGSFDDVAPEIMKGLDARPSVRAPDADVPPELDELCVAATRPDPADRLASALAMHEAVEAYLDGDRDLALRRENAERHAARARAAADALLSGDSSVAAEPARASALREVGRALGYDPSNKEALGTLVRLLTAPPRERPREVVAEERAALLRRIRQGGVAVAVVYGIIALNAWVSWAVGMREFHVFRVPQMMWPVASALGLVALWRPTYLALLLAGLVGIVTTTYTTELYSPFLIIPIILAMHSALFAFTGSRKLRYGIVTATVIGWTLSVYGSRFGIFSETVHMADGLIQIRSSALDMPLGRLTAYMYVGVLCMLIGPAVVVGALRGAWQRSEDALRLQAWQLRRLVATEETKIDTEVS